MQRNGSEEGVRDLVLAARGSSMHKGNKDNPVCTEPK